MALVTFVDDSAPYINAQNLNNNFGKHEITIGLGSDTTYTNATRGAVPLNTQMNKVGSKLSFDSTNHCIVVGNGVDYIEISGSIMQITDTTDLCGFLITKNGTYLDNAVSVHFNHLPVVGEIYSMSSAPVVVPVSAGDKFYLVDYANKSASTITLKAYNGRATYLTAKVVY